MLFLNRKSVRHYYRTVVQVDVKRLIRLTRRNAVKRVMLDRIELAVPLRSKASGFDRRRLRDADTSYPLLVTPGLHLIDGRHRLIKLRAAGERYAAVRVVTGEQLWRSMTPVGNRW